MTHDLEGWVFPAGPCLASRSPSGELVLFFLVPGPSDGDVGRSLWLPAEYGLCGVEPGVLHPQLCNMAMVNQAVQEADARVLGEIREEAESRKLKAESFGSGEKEIVSDTGARVKAHWKGIEARVLPGKKASKPRKKARRKTT